MPNVWIDTAANLTLANNASGNRSLMTGVSSTQTRFDSMTLIRTIIGIDVAYAVHDSGEGSQEVSLGIGVTSQEAFAAGSLPDPEIDTDFPARGWVWRARYRVFGFAADQPAVYLRRVEVDLRSQRKLENGECYLIGHNGPVDGVATTVQVSGMVRQLWKVT